MSGTTKPPGSRIAGRCERVFENPPTWEIQLHGTGEPPTRWVGPRSKLSRKVASLLKAHHQRKAREHLYSGRVFLVDAVDDSTVMVWAEVSPHRPQRRGTR